MAEVTAKLVKELRDMTGVGMMDAKRALVEVEGDIEKAVDLLRENGMAKAAKKNDRIAAEGLASVAIKLSVKKSASVVLKLLKKMTTLLSAATCTWADVSLS